jgi:hypothetical protein
MTDSSILKLAKKLLRAIADLEIGLVPRDRSFRARDVNPSTGLPLVGSSQAVDAAGNVRGVSPSQR